MRKLGVETPLALELKNRYFYKIWKSKCKHIKIMQKGSDYCDLCTKYLANAKDDEGLRRLLEQKTIYRSSTNLKSLTRPSTLRKVFINLFYCVNLAHIILEKDYWYCFTEFSVRLHKLK